MDPLNNVEAGRPVLGLSLSLSLVGARAIELAKTPREPINSEGWCGCGVEWVMASEGRGRRTFSPDGLCVRDEEGQGGGLRGGDAEFLVWRHVGMMLLRCWDRDAHCKVQLALE